MEVTNNAYEVLRVRQSFLTNRWIWIDAICINQADPVEKSEQVWQMQEVYRRTSRVIVWLGYDNDAKLAINVIQDV